MKKKCHCDILEAGEAADQILVQLQMIESFVLKLGIDIAGIMTSCGLVEGFFL